LQVAVALSGGVDSSVAAVLLQKQGHDLIGVTALLHPAKTLESDQNIYNARKIADFLKIPHLVFDLRDIFEKLIIKDFVSMYLSGQTPNPCLICNEYIKFGVLWQNILKKYPDCEAFATGHYAIIEKNKENKYLLKRAIDKSKDQSYMLYRLSSEKLAYIKTPLGNYLKKDVLRLASKYKLPIAYEKESQDICFVDDNYSSFIKKYLPNRKFDAGNIVDIDGKVLGKHQGIINYTIGQRKGLNLKRKGDNNAPLYVVAIDDAKNQIIVGDRLSLKIKECFIKDVHWLICPDKLVNMGIKIRYNSPIVKGDLLTKDVDMLRVIFKSLQSAVTPGQSAVFYKGDVVCGGGIIKKHKESDFQ